MGANPNTLSASFPKYWSRRMQRTHDKKDVYRAFCNFEEKATLKKGNTVDRPYTSDLIVNTLGADGSYTRQAITDVSSTLTIDQEQEVTFYIREIDEIQSNYRTANIYADKAAVRLGNKIDGDVLGEYDQASSVVGNYEMGGGGSASDGIGFTLTTSNILKFFGKVTKKLDRLDIDEADRWAIITPDVKDVLWQFLAGKESQLGDATGINGHIGKWGGFTLYKSNAAGWSGRFENGTIFAEGDTITINGVEFNFKGTLGAVAGTIHICTDQEKTLNSLVAAINTPGTSVDNGDDAGFVAVSAANQKLLKNVVATDGATYMTLKVTGKGYIAVSEVVTAPADIWTTTKQIQHIVFGQGKPIDLVIQKYPNMVTKDRSGYLGKDIVTWAVYGLKTFEEGADQLVDGQIRTDAF